VKEGEQLVVRGAEALREGAPVSVAGTGGAKTEAPKPPDAAKPEEAKR
jgi:hypothetical protein